VMCFYLSSTVEEPLLRTWIIYGNRLFLNSMAETLGAISSAFAVVSLALQLLDTVQQLHTFWQSFEDPGSDVERIKDHLATLHAIAASIAEACQQEPHIHHADSVISSLTACKARTEKLTHLMRDIGSNKLAGRWEKGWISLRANLRDKTIRRIESDLYGDVMMLNLALQPFFQSVSYCGCWLGCANIFY
jgi:hypothetical protein